MRAISSLLHGKQQRKSRGKGNTIWKQWKEGDEAAMSGKSILLLLCFRTFTRASESGRVSGAVTVCMVPDGCGRPPATLPSLIGPNTARAFGFAAINPKLGCHSAGHDDASLPTRPWARRTQTTTQHLAAAAHNSSFVVFAAQEQCLTDVLTYCLLAARGLYGHDF